MGLHYDQRMDIWSAGCIFYELIVGRPPFVADRISSDSEMIESIANYFKPVTEHDGAMHQGSVCEGREAPKLPKVVQKLMNDPV